MTPLCIQPRAGAESPAISLPCGFSEAGFPIGLQLVGRAFDEGGLLKVSYAYEQACEWHKRRPPLETIEEFMGSE